MVQGEPDKRITFTKAESADSAAPVWPSDIRLVDDFSVDVGRLQVMYKHKWRGICADHQKYDSCSFLCLYSLCLVFIVACCKNRSPQLPSQMSLKASETAWSLCFMSAGTSCVYFSVCQFASV